MATRTEQVMAAIRGRIDRRVLTPGARLPSIRAMASTMGVAASTVVEAYDRLAAEGAIRARQGSGFYVTAPLAPLAICDDAVVPEREIDPVWMLRQSLQSHPGAALPGCGWLPPEWMAEQTLRKGLRRLAREASTPALVGYLAEERATQLRQLIARRLFEQGVEAGTDQVLLVDSATHAIDLALRLLVEPGQTVLVDDPGYFNFHALLRAHRVRVVGVPVTRDGPDLDAFAAAVAAHRPRLYLTNSGLQNPTGVSLSQGSARRILRIAAEHDMAIIEDDIYADFEHAPSPRLAALDGLDRVIRVSSFSKTLTAAARCGYIVARHDWIAALSDLRIATGMTTSMLSLELVLHALTDGSYRRHVERLRVRLGQAMAQALPRLEALGITPFVEPAAGMFLWCRLPDGFDAVALARSALAANIVLAPGPVFSPICAAREHLRINVAMLDERVYDWFDQAFARGPNAPAG